MVAKTSTFPMDLTKTRLQLHGESQSVFVDSSTNVFYVASYVVPEQGVLGLYQGLSLTICGGSIKVKPLPS
ncbi:hypothetical protein PTKIN_Ptkin10aG0061300 [Pterospermum kingtungense]